MVKGFKVTVEPVDMTLEELARINLEKAPEHLKAKAIELATLLKVKHNVDIWSEDMQFINIMFEKVFRGLILRFQNGERNEDEIADNYKKYLQKWKQLTSVFKYAKDKYGVDMSDSSYSPLVISKIEEIADVVDTMYNTGKSLEDAYRYLTKLRSTFVTPEQGTVN